MSDEALLDELTGLYRAFYDGVFAPERAVPWLASMPADGCFIAIDLRDFRPINHARGRAFGDRYIAEIARRLSEAAAPWPAFRFGGDEFLIAARLAQEDLLPFAEKLREAVERSFEGETLQAQMAVAAAFEGETPRRLFEAADTALTAVTQNRWREIVVAPPEADHSTWFYRPTT